MARSEYDDDWMENEEKVLSTNLEDIHKSFRRYRLIIKTAKQELKEEQDKVRDLRNRLSQMASQRMTANNPCVEELSDPHRPTALATSWQSLFHSGGYWSAYEALKGTLGEKEVGKLLHTVTKAVYDVCVTTVEETLAAVVVFPGNALLDHGDLKSSVKKELAWKWVSKNQIDVLFPGERNFADDLMTSISNVCRQRLVDEITSQTSLVRSAALKFLKARGPPQSLEKKVHDALRQIIPSHSRELKDFVTQLQGLCYYMRVQDIPMEVDFTHDSGSSFDPHLFDLENAGVGNVTNGVIQCILRPPLLRNKDGPVLVKGEAEVDGVKMATGSPTPPFQTSATQSDKKEATRVSTRSYPSPLLTDRQSTEISVHASQSMYLSAELRKDAVQEKAAAERQASPQISGRGQGLKDADSKLKSDGKGEPYGSFRSPPKEYQKIAETAYFRQDVSKSPGIKSNTIQENAEDGRQSSPQIPRIGHGLDGTDARRNDEGSTEKENQTDQWSDTDRNNAVEEKNEESFDVPLSASDAKFYVSQIRVDIKTFR